MTQYDHTFQPVCGCVCSSNYEIQGFAVVNVTGQSLPCISVDDEAVDRFIEEAEVDSFEEIVDEASVLPPSKFILVPKSFSLLARIELSLFLPSSLLTSFLPPRKSITVISPCRFVPSRSALAIRKARASNGRLSSSQRRRALRKLTIVQLMPLFLLPTLLTSVLPPYSTTTHFHGVCAPPAPRASRIESFISSATAHSNEPTDIDAMIELRPRPAPAKQSVNCIHQDWNCVSMQ